VPTPTGLPAGLTSLGTGPLGSEHPQALQQILRSFGQRSFCQSYIPNYSQQSWAILSIFRGATLDVFPARGDGDGRCVASRGLYSSPRSRRVRNITIVSFGRVSTCSQAWCNTRQHAPERHGNAIGPAAGSVSRSALLSVATDSRWVAVLSCPTKRR
jgi:hypothetical protein